MQTADEKLSINKLGLLYHGPIMTVHASLSFDECLRDCTLFAPLGKLSANFTSIRDGNVKLTLYRNNDWMKAQKNVIVYLTTE